MYSAPKLSGEVVVGKHEGLKDGRLQGVKEARKDMREGGRKERMRG